MKIVVLDGYTLNPGDLSWAELQNLGECLIFDRTPPDDEDEIIRRIDDAEIVLTNKTPISRRTLESCPSVKFIDVLATGYNVVDVDCAREKKISVSNIPTYGTASVGQFAIALLLEICHHIGHHSAAVHEGRWTSNPDFCFWDYPLLELDGKTMGVIGYGRIGQTTGRIAQALGMEVIAFDAMREVGSELGGCKFVALDEFRVDARHHQSRQHCKDEGRRDHHQQQSRAIDCREGFTRGTRRRQSSGGGIGCRFD